MKIFIGLNILLLTLSSFSFGDSPELLTCQLKHEKFVLQKEKNGNYSLRFTATGEYLFRIVKIDEILAKNLECKFAGPNQQLLRCSEIEEQPVDPTVRGASGSIHHSLWVNKKAVTFMNEKNEIETTSTASVHYNRSQQIWQSPIIVHTKDEDGKPLSFSLGGSISYVMNESCFKY